MPAKGTKLQVGKRVNVITPALWKAFVQESKINISYSDFSNIISSSNTKIKTKILDNIMGFKAPEGLGYWTITKFKSKKRSVDYKQTKEHGQVVYHTNFHSFGYSFRLQWLTAKISDIKHVNIYKFVPERDFSRKKARKIIDEKKVYNEQSYDFYKGRTLKLNIDKQLQKILNGTK